MNKTQLSKRECYYCGAIEVNEDHVPPTMLFRSLKSGERPVPIKVPACAIHNGDEKSRKDQRIISGMLQSLALAGETYTPKVRNAIKHLMSGSTLSRTRNYVNIRKIVRDLDIVLIHVDLPHDDWIRQITAGLVYDGLGKFDSTIDWENCYIFSNTFYPGSQYSYQQLVDKFDELTEATLVWESDATWFRGWYSDSQTSDIRKKKD